MKPYSPEAFFNLSGSPAADLFRELTYVWEAVALLPEFIEKTIVPEIKGAVEEGAWLEPGNVQLGEGSRVMRGAIIHGPAIIGRDTVVRSGAYIRGHVMIGDGCLIGHGTELRQLLVLNNSNIPHLNCFFTSLVGNRVKIGGSTHTANMLLNGKKVEIRIKAERETITFPTGQTLFGTVIGDDCNVAGVSVLQAGSVIGRRSVVFPQCSVSGYIPPDSMMRPVSVPFEVVTRDKKGG
ncbi:MAG: hypothetical protein QGH40_10655 [bacterium]|nr:hypothetical protein [bacterium]